MDTTQSATMRCHIDRCDALSYRPYAIDGLDNGRQVVIEATLKVKDFEAYCDVLTRVRRNSPTAEYRYEPTLIVGTHSISKEQKLELLFAGYVL